MSVSRSLALWRLARATPRVAFLARSQGQVQLAVLRPAVLSHRKFSEKSTPDSSDDPTSDPGSIPHADPASSSEPSPNLDPEDQSRAILEASLQFVPQFGWSPVALAEGAKSLGLPGVAHGMFPREGGELIDHFEVQCNAQLVEYMQKTAEEESLKGGELLQDALEQRLRMIIPFIDKWPQAMALKAFPSNAPHALENLALMVDDVWFCAGDRSTDFNWYTKRALLATIYSSTEVYLVQDSSVDFQDTWDFLRRRMEDATNFAKGSQQVQEFMSGGLEFLFASFTTARNMLGMNSRNR